MRTITRDGGPAFPIPESSGNNCDPGMTLRQWYAGNAMQGLLAKHGDFPGMVTDAYDIADAMIAAADPLPTGAGA